MPWYLCNSVVGNAAAKFIGKCRQFKQQTKVVVSNEKWEVENTGAMSVIRLWGSKAVLFKRKRSGELWEEHSNNWLKLVAIDAVFQSIEQSFERNELMFLCGSAEDSNPVEQIGNILSSKTYASFNFKFFNITTNPKRNQFLSPPRELHMLEDAGKQGDARSLDAEADRAPQQLQDAKRIGHLSVGSESDPQHQSPGSLESAVGAPILDQQND
ncbi:uncharacterized protein LOC115726656 [Rhodamnia argentea]|uniref:Uncharacterized protein LOC115726656 n=1 Tax=Rhodamnia argentea TaxID=178133 RepID=A0A8B8MQW1_9MYRT|nr:uncharacterized protein LOC115726656 [Rhodamnia argentea]